MSSGSATGSRGRASATAARRDQIVGAAVALLADRGYPATTFDAICAHAGLSSKRLITYHFSGKDELFAAIAERVVADAEVELQAAVTGVRDPRQRLAAVIRASIVFMAAHPREIGALQQIIRNGGRAWDEHHERSVGRLAALIADAQSAGLRPGDPRILATALRASIDAMHAPLAAGIDPGHCADELTALFDVHPAKTSTGTNQTLPVSESPKNGAQP